MSSRTSIQLRLLLRKSKFEGECHLRLAILDDVGDRSGGTQWRPLPLADYASVPAQDPLPRSAPPPYGPSRTPPLPRPPPWTPINCLETRSRSPWTPPWRPPSVAAQEASRGEGASRQFKGIKEGRGGRRPGGSAYKRCTLW